MSMNWARVRTETMMLKYSDAPYYSKIKNQGAMLWGSFKKNNFKNMTLIQETD